MNQPITIKKSRFPDWYEPMLATLTDKRFSRKSWVYEPKLDGERSLVYHYNGHLHIFSRNKILLNHTYPDLVKAFERQNTPPFIVDGEIVAFEKGVSNFSKLQQRLNIKHISLEDALKMPVYFYLFDILFYDEVDLRSLPFYSRRNYLQTAFIFQDPLRLIESRIGEGEAYYKQACQRGWEGIIAKRLNSPYQGKRSLDWLKFKCYKSQELVIVGYTAPKGYRKYFGALLVGYYEDNQLHYAGKVGTGFSFKTLKALIQKMNQYISPTSPFFNQPIREPHVTWLNPVLVGDFHFTEWTADSKLRHPSFKGLRYDKVAKDVIKEIPQ